MATVLTARCPEALTPPIVSRVDYAGLDLIPVWRATVRSILCVTAIVLLLAGCTAGSEPDQASDEPATSPSNAGSSPASSPDGPTSTGSPDQHARRVIRDCSMQSWGQFGQAFTNPDNVVVGPLVFEEGNVTTPAAVVQAQGGSKYPVLVKLGHVVTVQIPREVRRTAELVYGPGHITSDTIRFVACPRGEKKSNASSAGGRVTFWSGFVMTRSPGCIPLDVYVDEESSPRHAAVTVGPNPCENASS